MPAPSSRLTLTSIVGSLGGACRLVVWLSALVMNAPIAWHVARGSRGYLGFFADDFYYYVVIADRLVQSGHLTFDGLHPTNGFHPLWLGCLALIRLVCGGTGGAFYVALAIVDAAIAIATFELLVKLGRALGAREAIAGVAAAFMIWPLNHAFADGMEVTLAIPLCAALLLAVARTTDELAPRRAAWLGFLSSLAILARLDLTILVAMMVMTYTVTSRGAFFTRWPVAASFAAGGLAFPAYLVANRLLYGTLLSTSATAKQLTTSSGFNLEFVRSAIMGNYLGAKVLVATIGAALLLALRRSRVPTPAARLAAALALAFPAAYYLVCGLRSPWLCFPWYSYALYPALLVGLVVVGEFVAAHVTAPRLRLLASFAAIALLLRVVIASVGYGREHAFAWGIEDNLLTANAFELARRMQGRPGVYAMGDKAGNVANVMKEPIVQLEGLVADPAMVEHVRAQDPLLDVLRAYAVDYLVVSVGPNVPLPKRDGCYAVMEPNVHEAGERSPKMRGLLCSEPIADYEVPRAPHAWSNYDFPIHTYVFDVRTPSAGP